MLCEKCKKNASVHYRFNDNGKVTETHLCTDCARESGLLLDNGVISSDFMSDKGGYVDNYSKIPFSSLFGTVNIKPSDTRVRVCTGCGMTEDELRANGKLGCERCYFTFADYVNIMLDKMHMSLEYKGKIPSGRSEILSLKRKIEKLKNSMQTAVDNQEYEEAARIRDMIRSLENDYSNQKNTDGGEKN